MDNPRDVAVEHCLWAMQAGLKPQDVLAMSGCAWKPTTTWQQAIRAIAYAYKVMMGRGAAA